MPYLNFSSSIDTLLILGGSVFCKKHCTEQWTFWYITAQSFHRRLHASSLSSSVVLYCKSSILASLWTTKREQIKECTAWTPPWAVVIIMTTTEINSLRLGLHTLNAVCWSTQPSILRWALKRVSAFGLGNNNKWQWWLKTAGYQYTHSTNRLAWSECHWVCIRDINKVKGMAFGQPATQAWKLNLRTSVQSNLAKGYITKLSPLMAVNVFIWSWPNLTHGSLDPQESASHTTSQSIHPFIFTHRQIHRQTDTQTTLYLTCGRQCDLKMQMVATVHFIQWSLCSGKRPYFICEELWTGAVAVALLDILCSSCFEIYYFESCSFSFAILL